MKEEKGCPETRDLYRQVHTCYDKPIDIKSRSPSDLSQQALTCHDKQSLSYMPNFLACGDKRALCCSSRHLMFVG